MGVIPNSSKLGSMANLSVGSLDQEGSPSPDGYIKSKTEGSHLWGPVQLGAFLDPHLRSFQEEKGTFLA